MPKRWQGMCSHWTAKKNINMLTTTRTICLVIFIGAALQVQAQTETPNTLTKAEQKAGWKLLFDGKSSAGWHAWKKDKIGSAWKLSDDAMYRDASSKAEGQKLDAGDLVTDGEFENYELMVDWKIAPCGNSGIIFNVVE